MQHHRHVTDFGPILSQCILQVTVSRLHAVNHTCHRDFENCKFLHTGVTKDPRGVGEEDEGGAGGSRTSVVFVQATRRVEREEEFFANYGDSFRFPHGCQCHLCASTAAV